MNFSIKDFFSKCDQIRAYLTSRSLESDFKKSLMGNFIFLCGDFLIFSTFNMSIVVKDRPKK